MHMVNLESRQLEPFSQSRCTFFWDNDSLRSLLLHQTQVSLTPPVPRVNISPDWRSHLQRRLRHRAYSQFRERDSPHGSISSRHLAPSCLASETESCSNEVGIDQVMLRAVFLDRDGVINRAMIREGRPYPPGSVAELEILPGVAEALGKLREAGFLLIVVTNQPDVARGMQTRENIEAIHARLLAELPLDEIMTCYHDGDSCECRKPKPGALLDAKRRCSIDLEHSFMIGDRWRDIEAGQRAGCTCVFIDYGYNERQPDGPFIRVSSLAEAADWILAQVCSSQCSELNGGDRDCQSTSSRASSLAK